MGDLMVGLGLLVMGSIFFFLADMFVKYPASANAPPPWPYMTMRVTAFLLGGVGIIFLALGFL